ncbi:hypothetical protein Tco_1431967, partial [Tanacetum coccineum]
ISLPGLTSAIYHMSMGNSDLMGGDGWTSSLAEVPIMMGNNGNSGSAPRTCSRNMFSTRKITIAMVDELNSNGSTTVNKVRVSHASDCIMNACGYDYLIGTSEHGHIVKSSDLELPSFRNALVQPKQMSAKK